MFYPSYYYESVFQIPYESLYEKGVRYLIYDIDNTLAGYDESQPSIKVRELIGQLQGWGFKVALLSNNNLKRVQVFNECLELISEANAGKPLTRKARKIMSDIGATVVDTAIIGDQIFIDIWCGNSIGCLTILVKPLTVKDVLMVKVKRRLEQVIIQQYEKNNR